jgi:hypothetical protein
MERSDAERQRRSMTQSNDVQQLDSVTHDTHDLRESVVRLESIGADIRIGVHLDVGSRHGREAPEASDGSTVRAELQAELGTGRLIAGRYELKRLLGRGSMGAVWLATHRALDEEVAIKLLVPAGELTGIENASTTAARFRFEAQVAARLSRKTRHVVRVTDHGRDGDLAFLVMERLEGQTLERALLNRGPMRPLAVSALVTQIARGLEVAHADGVLHRDLKPSNIFLTANEDGSLLVKILDFGIARRDRTPGVDTRFATAKGILFGTPGYMSPEQASASPDLDARADLWSVAAIAYEALTGELPVTGHDTDQMLANLRAGKVVPLRERNAELAEECERFFERAFALELGDRHSSCEELAVEFERAAQAADSHGPARTLPLRTLKLAAGTPPARPRRRAKVAIAFVATALALGAVWGAFALQARPALGMGPATTAAVAGPTLDQARASSVVVTPVATSAPVEVSAPADLSAPVKRPSPPSRGDLGEFKAYF